MITFDYLLEKSKKAEEFTKNKFKDHRHIIESLFRFQTNLGKNFEASMQMSVEKPKKIGVAAY